MAAPPDPLTIARAELAPGERLIWAARPLPRPAGGRTAGLVAIGVIMALAALFWTAEAWAAGRSIAWLGPPFIGLGIAFASSPLWRRNRAALVYAVSDRRLLMIRGWPRPRVRSFGPAELQAIEVHERPDGSGDLIFRRETVLWPPPLDNERRRLSVPRIHRTGFFAIPDPQRVAAAVRKLKASAGVAPSAGPRQ